MCCVYAVQEKLRNIQIGSLIGKPLGWTSGEEEVRDFRAKMARLFDFDNWELGEKGFANIQQVLCPLLSFSLLSTRCTRCLVMLTHAHEQVSGTNFELPLAAEQVRVKLHFPSGSLVRTLLCSADDTVYDLGTLSPMPPSQQTTFVCTGERSSHPPITPSTPKWRLVCRASRSDRRCPSRAKSATTWSRSAGNHHCHHQKLQVSDVTNTTRYHLDTRGTFSTSTPSCEAWTTCARASSATRRSSSSWSSGPPSNEPISRSWSTSTTSRFAREQPSPIVALLGLLFVDSLNSRCLCRTLIWGWTPSRSMTKKTRPSPADSARRNTSRSLKSSATLSLGSYRACACVPALLWYRRLTANARQGHLPGGRGLWRGASDAAAPQGRAHPLLRHCCPLPRYIRIPLRRGEWRRGH